MPGTECGVGTLQTWHLSDASSEGDFGDLSTLQFCQL